MARSVEIPQDIIDNIIEAVGNLNDKFLLKQCTLVSSSFLLPSRKQLFSRITLRNDETCMGIHRFLVQNPVIQAFVRAITLMDSQFLYHKFPRWINGISLLALLRLPFGCLQSFSIDIRFDGYVSYPWEWDNFNNELQDALSNIVHSSNLKTLSLKGIRQLPSTIFPHIVQLRTLELFSPSPEDFGNEKGVGPTASHATIERCVWRLREDCDRRSIFVRGPTESTFLPFMSHLRFLEIYINLGSGRRSDFELLSYLMKSLCISLTFPATLEHLNFNIWFRGNSNEFQFYNSGFYNDLRDADCWSQLDSIVTHPSGSRLQRVDIIINYSFEDKGEKSDKGKVLKAVRDGLPILRSNGILFVKAVPWY